MSKLKFECQLDFDIIDFEVLASLLIVVCLNGMVVLVGTFGTNVVNIAMLNLYYVMLRYDSGLYVIWLTRVETLFKLIHACISHRKYCQLLPY